MQKHVWQVRHLTDEYGTVIRRANYDPYGLPLNTLPSSLGFTGELTDPTGLVYLRALQNKRAASPWRQRSACSRCCELRKDSDFWIMIRYVL